MLRSTQAYIRVLEHLGLHAGIGALKLANKYRGIRALIHVQEHHGVHTGMQASGLAQRYRSTKVCIQVQKHSGLHTGLGAFGLAYRYMSTSTCMQVKEHLGLYTGVGVFKLAYNMINSTFIHHSYNVVHNWAREPAKGSQRVYTGLAVQILAYRYMHSNIRRLVCPKCLYNWYGFIVYFVVTS